VYTPFARNYGVEHAAQHLLFRLKEWLSVVDGGRLRA
jgi:hypothetical protein